jgi:hypothetical protein
MVALGYSDESAGEIAFKLAAHRTFFQRLNQR